MCLQQVKTRYKKRFMTVLEKRRKKNGRADDKRGTLFTLRRPSSYWGVLVYHLPLGFASALALALPYLIPLQHFPAVPCTFLSLTGIPCPFCGFTRSFWAISHGELWIAVVNCPLSLVVYLVVLVCFIWNAYALLSGVLVFPGSFFSAMAVKKKLIVTVVCLLFAGNWLYRIGMGFY